jgi:hypothetical protein
MKERRIGRRRQERTYLRDWHEATASIRAERRNRPAIDSDHEDFTALCRPKDRSARVAQLTLGDPLHLSTVAYLLHPLVLRVGDPSRNDRRGFSLLAPVGGEELAEEDVELVFAQPGRPRERFAHELKEQHGTAGAVSFRECLEDECHVPSRLTDLGAALGLYERLNRTHVRTVAAADDRLLVQGSRTTLNKWPSSSGFVKRQI